MSEKELTLADLKAGDEAVIESGYTRSDYKIVKITRITPTGQIVVTSDHTERRFDKNGSEKVSRNRWTNAWLRPLTADVRIAMLRKELTHLKWGNVEPDVIVQVARLVGLQNDT